MIDGRTEEICSFPVDCVVFLTVGIKLVYSRERNVSDD